MGTTRREFIGTAVAAGTIGAFGTGSVASAASRVHEEELKEGLAVGGLKDVPEASRKMKILILGGTGFLGPHIVQYAQARGHEVTIFHRGRTNPHLFEGVEKLIGNRDPNKDAGLTALEGKSWDAAIDTSSYYPRVTRAATELLKDNIDFYTLITSISVYKDHATAHADENYPLGTMEDESVEEVNGLTYGPLKALCEKAAEEVMPGRVSHIRPGLIVGPRDSTDRFSYWPVRVERGGEVLAPGNHDDASQWIDARDLARFCVLSVENKLAGPYNAVGPDAPSNIAELLYGCKAVTGGNVTFTWADAEFLASNGVGPWMNMPVWVPGDGDLKGIMTSDVSKALGDGMTIRPLAETVADTLTWWHTLPEERRARMRAGISADKEKEVLMAWHETQAEKASSDSLDSSENG